MSKSHIKQKSILIFFFFTTLTQYALSFTVQGTDEITPVDYDQSAGFVSVSVTQANAKQKFRLDFPNGEAPRGVNFVRVTLKKDTADIPMPILHFSSTDDNCADGRQQIAKDPNSDTVTMLLKTEEFSKDDLFVLVELLSTDKSDYTLTFTGSATLDLSANFVYSYLVGTGNREVQLSAELSENEVDAVTIYAVGSKSISLTVDGISGITKFSLGSAVTFKPTNSGLYSITVKADEGDYITIGVNNVANAKSEGDLLKPNGNEVSGFLLKDVLEDQCFEMSILETAYKNKNLYITGRFYNRIAQVYYRDSSFKEIADTSKNVTDGYFTSTLTTSGNKNSICVRFIPDAYTAIKNIPFTLYVTETTSINSQYKFYPPQVLGQIYRRIIPKNSAQFYSSLTLPQSKRIMFNLKTKKGFPKMYSGKCKQYPQCNFDDTDLINLDAPRKANRMFTFSYNSISDSKALSSEKYVIFVKCLDDDNAGSGYCEFETSFIPVSDEIELIEDETFGFYGLKDDKGTFKINLEGESNWKTINVDIMVLSGDASFDAKSEDTTLNFRKYFLSNKVYFKVESEENDEIKTISIDYRATLNSYFTIKWNANRQGDNTQYRDYIVSGFSYLVDLDPTSISKTKTIKLLNLRHKDNKPFLANFFALNCEYKVTRESEEIKFYDGYAQEVLTTASDKYNEDYYDYVVSIKDADLSNYNNKMCMLYIAGYETSTDLIPSEILISENVNQQIIFENGINTVRFLYPQPDSSKDLVLKVNVVDTSIYKISIYAESTFISNIELSRTEIIYIPKTAYQKACPSNNLCSIIIQVELEKDLVGTNPMVEIILRPILNTPTYLQKGQAKQDFVCGERYYYLYTDVGKNEEGEILVDFMRRSGQVYAKVVRKDQTSTDEEANWRDIYRMPSSEWEDSLAFNSYLKKLQVKPEDTSDCIEGCYLLVAIRLSYTDDYIEDYRFYPFSIITRVTPSNRAYTDIPKVVIQTDEYIVGNVDVSENERIYEFYEIWLPHDSELVQFDWQSGVAGMYINLGGTRPTTKNADFKLLPHCSDQILSITKGEIIDKAKTKSIPLPYTSSIQDVNLVIGIWTDRADSKDTELFSLRVHQPMVNELDIVEVNSFQKVQCRPVSLDDYNYRCLFMIVYENSQTIANVLAYGASNDRSARNYIYGRFIDREIYDQYKSTELKANIPTNENADLNSKSDSVDYLFATKVESEKYLYVSVISDSPEDMTFLTYLGDYNYLVYPNPSSEQVVVVLPVHLVSLQFNTDTDIIANIVTVAGEAEVYWANEPGNIYQLKGSGDKLTITSGTFYKDNRRCNLIIRNKNTSSAKTKMPDPGFVFYISFFLRNPEINFDEVQYGKSLQIAYKDTDFPLYLFSKIHQADHDINVAISYDNVVDNGEQRLFFENAPFKFNVALVKESVAYLAKNDPELRPSYDKSIIGVYDPAIKTVQAFLSISDLESFNVKYDDRPTLYFGLDKSEINKLTYSRFSMEVSVMKSNDDVSPIEGVYNYGKVDINTKKNYFKLKIDKNNKVMRVQISFNSDSLDFVINDNEESSVNMTFIEQKRSYGKIIVTLNVPTNLEFLYLIIFIKDKNLAADQRLNNYCFKYLNAESSSSFTEYKTVSESRNIIYNENALANSNITNITVNIAPVENAKNYNVTYTLKVVPNNTHVYKESYNTIAVSESPSSFVSMRNMITGEIETIQLEIYNVNAVWVYIEVVAEIQDGNNYDYLAYEGIYKERPYVPLDNSSGVNILVFIIVGGVLVVAVIALIIVFVVIKNKNKTLLNQVKHVSFQKTNSNTDPNLLLNKPQNSQENQA